MKWRSTFIFNRISINEVEKVSTKLRSKLKEGEKIVFTLLKWNMWTALQGYSEAVIETLLPHV